jgi:transposase
MPVRDQAKGGAPRKYGDRLVLNGIFFVLRSGCQWRMIPRDLLPWDAAYRWYAAWRADGTWDRIHDALRDQVRVADGRDPAPSAGVPDVQSILTGEGGQARGYDAGKRTRGRKRHIVTDTLGLLLVVMVTSASVQDRHGGKAILEFLAARFGSIALIWADAGYANQIDSGLVTWARKTISIVVQIITRSDDVTGFQVLPRRWVVERTFGWLIRSRRLSRDYERRIDKLRDHDQDRDDQADGYPPGRRTGPLEQPRRVTTQIPNSHSGASVTVGLSSVGPPSTLRMSQLLASFKITGSRSSTTVAPNTDR